VNERQFQVAGFADTVPLAANDSPEGRAYNRRVDIVLLSPGHL
jgi:chemotaxis protein MotB